ncbi:MAG: hypothetical protein K9L85_03570 [Candidatus Peribacteraceae bacterium]|nr:hypothetical protein [Candidatus Peribacteraceae bacterium]
MAHSRTLPTIITFSAIALALAATAAILPSGESRKDIRDLRVEYGIDSEPSAAPGETGDESIFDFLRFRVQPAEVGPEVKITRSRQPINKQIIDNRNKSQIDLVRSPVDSVVIVADNSAEILRALEQSLEHDQSVSELAVQSSDPTGCDTIENVREQENCRGEIYFQKAIIAKDAGVCSQIENLNLKLRCQNYVNLIPRNEISN